MAEQSRGAAVWIATCGGVGFFPIAPGTAGSAVGLVLVVVLGRAPLAQPWRSSLLAFVALGLFFLGVWAAGAAEKHFGQIDPGPVVIDEVVGQLLTFLALPGASWKWLLAGFVLFRIFDITKPWPIRKLEKLPGGWGVLADDLMAGVFAAIVLQMIFLYY